MYITICRGMCTFAVESSGLLSSVASKLVTVLTLVLLCMLIDLPLLLVPECVLCAHSTTRRLIGNAHTDRKGQLDDIEYSIRLVQSTGFG